MTAQFRHDVGVYGELLGPRLAHRVERADQDAQAEGLGRRAGGRCPLALDRAQVVTERGGLGRLTPDPGHVEPEFRQLSPVARSS
jgi:hypothetical protein